MRCLLCSLLMAAVVVAAGEGLPASAQSKDKTKDAKTPAKDKDAPKVTGKETPAELTRNVLLKTKVEGSYDNMRLGEILKDLGDQVDMKGDLPVMWTYGKGFPYSQKVTFTCGPKPLDVVLDQLLKKAGDGLGYVVVSKEGDKYDGWVRLTTTGERGVGKDEPGATGVASAEDEASAAEKLALAKKLLDAGKQATAKPVLEILVKKYGNTKAGAEAKEILEKLDK